MKNSDKIVHVVSFNIPYPPDYGGVMDVFYKIAALKKQGVGIILHCFSYGRSRSHILEKECLRVHYYQRKLNLFLLFRNRPFIVLSRESNQLLSNLAADQYPIIFEGLHTTLYLTHPLLDGRLMMVRTHNVEHLYYGKLVKAERNPLRKFFFRLEALKLERYEKCLSHASLLLTISPGDTEYFRNRYGRTLFVGPFHPSDGCHSAPGNGNYILLHGDFSTPENNSSAIYLLKNIVSQWQYTTILAGKRPSREVVLLASGMKHVKLIPNPSTEEMDKLITEAQICLLHAIQPSGMKLKLINALCSGKHIIASPPVVSGTDLESLCHIAGTDKEWLSLTDMLMSRSFTREDISGRHELLSKVASNRINATRIIESINNYYVHP